MKDKNRKEQERQINEENELKRGIKNPEMALQERGQERETVEKKNLMKVHS